MCGICGFWQAEGLGNGDERPLRDMMGALAHRGPDGEGSHVDAKCGIALGHRRLSINDLTFAGVQPLSDRSRRHFLIVNGEFYEFRAHRARLQADGEQFCSTSDSEIAIGLYKRLGLPFVEHLRGEFAFALFDYDRDQLLLVRDRFGVRPLFYHATRRRIIWGSEIKAILAHPAVTPRLDRRAALHQMMQIMVPGTSAFENVRSLQPGHMLTVRRNGDALVYETRCYWDLGFPTEESHQGSDDVDEHAVRVREGVLDAVRVRLDADVPVGCYLSSGIDSSSILAVTSALGQPPKEVFTIGFDDPRYDESVAAWVFTRQMGVKHDVVRVALDDLYGEHLWKAIRHAERTVHNTLCVAKQHLSWQVNACGYKAVLTGEGADELFAGYDDFRMDLMERPSGESGAWKTGPVANGQQHHGLVDLCGFTPAWIQPWLAVLGDVRSLFNDSTRDELAEYDPVLAIAEGIDASQLAGRHPLDRVQYLWIKTVLEGQILSWGGDRMDMTNAIESRPAFLDHKVAEIAVAVPPRLRMDGSGDKMVLRKAMADLLPVGFCPPAKFGFSAPPPHQDGVLKDAVARTCRDVLTEERIRRVGLFSPHGVHTFVKQFGVGADGPALIRRDKILHHLLSIHMLHDVMVEPRSDKVG